MKLDHLRLKGLLAFREPVDLALRDLPAGVIAITGTNGSGKTTTIDSIPAALFRRLPARNDSDPVAFASGRDAYIDLGFTFDGIGTYRARLSLDGDKRKSDGVLVEQLEDGTERPLNDGKVSTYDAALKTLLPSFDLFINSAFAAQGRGDEFTRRKPSQRKDLFAEFLNLQHYADKAKAAAAAADLVDDAHLRLTVKLETTERDLSPDVLDILDRQAQDLETIAGRAERRQRELKDAIADLETRLALVADQASAFATATERVRALRDELAAKQAEWRLLDQQRGTLEQTRQNEIAAIDRKLTTTVAGLDEKIAGNTQIQDMADGIRKAVVELKEIAEATAEVRQALDTIHANQKANADALRQAEKDLAAFTPLEYALTRAQGDTALLATVPCGGAGEYAACQFLTNATEASRAIAELEARLLAKAAAADHVGALVREREAHVSAAAALQPRLTALEARRADVSTRARYAEPLAASDARLAELQTQRDRTHQDADDQRADATARATTRRQELDQRAGQLEAAIASLTARVAAADHDLQQTIAGNSQAQALRTALDAQRIEWDRTTSLLATTASQQTELARRRADVLTKQAQAVDIRARLSRVDQERLEWRDLAKAFGKGGLPDLEIDAAGPTISATTNAVLLSCFGPRFSVELVTQVSKADGSGAKDLFTVQVHDNERGGDPRDISALSGGERTVIQEALMSAIALYVNERSPMPMRTFFRDETGAALDRENAVRYVQMLRRVRELGHLDKIYFVSHNDEAKALADAQIQVAEGQARIVLPPFVEQEAA